MSDAARFEAFVREYQDVVFGTAVRLLGNDAEAEDVAQTVFLRAYERFSGLRGNPAAAGWLKKVATNLCLNHLTRYRARWQFFSELEPSPGEYGQPIALARTPSASVELERAERHERLERALRRLPDYQRVPLVLFHFEEMSYQDIADALGVSLGKVKTDIHRARETLRQELSIFDGSR